MEKELSKAGFWQQVYLMTLKEKLSKGLNVDNAESTAYCIANRAIKNFEYEVAPEGCLHSEFVKMVMLSPNTINPNNGDK
jgi:hypothetical protein